MVDKKVEQIKRNNKQKKDYIFAVGRRREAVARIRLFTEVKPEAMWGQNPIKKGEILVNEKPVADYFSSDVESKIFSEPLRVTNTQNKYAITIKVAGGGKSGQLDAVVAGIANVLCALDSEQYRPILKKKGFLTRDSRIRERRKVGTGGKARRAKQSPKR